MHLCTLIKQLMHWQPSTKRKWTELNWSFPCFRYLYIALRWSIVRTNLTGSGHIDVVFKDGKSVNINRMSINLTRTFSMYLVFMVIFHVTGFEMIIECSKVLQHYSPISWRIILILNNWVHNIEYKDQNKWWVNDTYMYSFTDKQIQNRGVQVNKGETRRKKNGRSEQTISVIKIIPHFP